MAYKNIEDRRAYHREYQREYRKWLKEHHFCRDCQKQDAYTLAGRTYFFDCAEKGRIKKENARKDPIKKEKMLKQKRDQITRYINENRCVRCGMQLNNGKRMCSVCYELQRRASRKRKGNTPRMRGIICWQCNKQPCMEGYGLCKDCYEKKIPISLQNLEKSRENHPWRKSICR